MQTPLTELNWRLILTAVLATTVATLPTFLAASSIAQAGAELGYGALELGYLVSSFFLVAAVSSSQIGRLVERLGWRTAMRASTAFAIVILIMISLLVNSVWVLGVFLMLAAASYGMVNPAANMALARDIPADRRALVFGLKHAGIPLSTMFSGFAVPLVVIAYGWRSAYQAAAILGIGVWFLIPRERPATQAEQPAESARGAMMPLKYLSLLGVGSAFATVSAATLGTFTVDAAIARDMDPGSAGTLLAVASLTSLVARAAYGYWADRRRATGFGSASVLMLIGGVVFFLLIFTTSATFAILTVVLFGTAWAWPGLMTYGIVRANQGRPAGSTAITQAGIFIGAGLGPTGIGWLVENYSYEAGWAVTGIFLFIAASIVMWIRRIAVLPMNVS